MTRLISEEAEAEASLNLMAGTKITKAGLTETVADNQPSCNQKVTYMSHAGAIGYGYRL